MSTPVASRTPPPGPSRWGLRAGAAFGSDWCVGALQPPVLVLVAPLVGASFTLVLPPLLVVALVMAGIIALLVVNDGESTWLEGATLIVLYLLIATAFWWG